MSSQKRKYVERACIVFALIGTIVVGSGYVYLYLQARHVFTSQEQLYGMWVEQDVAPYAASTINIRSGTIMMQGHTVATQFRFNGEVLSFNAGGSEYRYRMLNDDHTQMRLISSANYNPTFRLSKKFKNDLR
ncbi:MAG: DUF2850 domain-containing protein [Vibrio sp.]